MTLANPNSTGPNTVTKPTAKRSSPATAWYRPMFSPEHGVYVMLFVSLLTGAAAAQQWTLNTTLACIAAFAGFQAEHPLVLQIKQRRSWKPRFLVWGGLYGALSLGLAVYLALAVPTLLWLYLGAIAAVVVDAIAVLYRQQKSLFNELFAFAAVCLAAPFVYIATTGTWNLSLIGLWLVNTLFFGSAIFTVKLRKPKTADLKPGLVYHAIASLMIVGLWSVGWLSTFSAIAFTLVLVKFGLILWQLDWYKRSQIQPIAVVETSTAMLFLSALAISLLPAHLAR